jgi:hypothetical protein
MKVSVDIPAGFTNIVDTYVAVALMPAAAF